MKYWSGVQNIFVSLVVMRVLGLARSFHSPSSPASRTPVKLFSTKPENIAIVGGGLGGLSTAYHLRQALGQDVHITIFDKCNVGEGGASSVAGGLLHPFSPKGKLINLGLEGLESTNNLLEAAKKHNPDCILRDRLFRIALSEKNVDQLKLTAELHPEYATWLEPDDLEKACGTSALGGIALENGCYVIHVTSYLQGLWEAVRTMSPEKSTWQIVDPDTDWKETLASFDTAIFSAGSGLFHDEIFQKDAQDFPVELVRGQSAEMHLESDASYPNEAILCGKYMTPLPDPNKVLIGATHEYKSEPLDELGVLDELKKRSYDISPFVWEEGKLDRVTIGYRVQSRRGKFGRIPIIGKSKHNDVHPNSFLFTGLSARGLIYHGIYGQILSRMVVENDETSVLEDYPDISWWK
ncbi:hypothetical protein CTEN210_02669 [Chaetoceros tenuissimus]|uniref:FAD dependent oxidoreductase domain-containing protein n=1 Tax=Chaetoceros tenuissimus TaxID=426638 RepID=A0AAD3CJE3_9STRA|nr:hypothetical protein CTEN210_02669 [Chaetoceros tenuissimus]